MRERKRSVGVHLVALAGVLTALGFATTVHGADASATAQSATKQPWDLVYISDSSGWGVASFYGRKIRKALGVQVRVHDEWQPNLSAMRILESLRSPSDPWVPLVRNAEVVVVYGNPVGLEIVRGGDCVTSSKPPLKVAPRLWVKYVSALKAIYKRVFEIRNGRPVILRTANWYVPVVRAWDEAGILPSCTLKWESFSAAIVEAAAAYRVPVANVYAAFNGTTHLEDPVAKDYIQPDGVHPNNKGRAVIAKTLSDLGYRQVKAPR